MATAETSPPEVEVTHPLDQIRTLLRQLTFPQKLSLNAELAQDLLEIVPQDQTGPQPTQPGNSAIPAKPDHLPATPEGSLSAPPAKKPFPSFRGALSDLGPAPSAEDIDEMRREAWANFPREEFFQ